MQTWMRRRLEREGVGLGERVLADDERAAARREHPLDDGEPVVGLVVEDAVGDAVRLVLPRPHELRAVVGGVGESIPDLVVGAALAAGGDGVVGAPERPGALGLHRVEAGGRRNGIEHGCLVEGLGAGARERAATDLHDEAVEGHAGRREVGGELVAERLAAFHREPVQVSLAGERERSLGDRLQEPVHGRIARLPCDPRADGEVRPELLEPGENHRIGVDRDEDAKRAPTRSGDDRRGERGIAATRDREVGAAGGVGQPELLRDLEVEQHPEQVAGLVRPRDVPGLVLDPDAAPLREPEPLAQRIAAGEGRGGEAVPVDGGDLPVEPAHERAERLVREAAGDRNVIGAQEGAVADERVRLRVVQGEAHGREVEVAPQDVVEVVVRPDVRARERIRVARVGLGAAAGADEPAGGCRHRASRTPVRALKSSISASQSPTSSWIPLQNSGLLRASKSSSEMPCCSTQV